MNLAEALTSHGRAVQLINDHPITRVILDRQTRIGITTTLATIPALCDETEHLRVLLDIAQLDRANLVAAARATLTADHDGEPDPLWYLRDELVAHGQFPNFRRQA